MYIVTSNGISYYNYNDSLSSVNNQIYNTINNNIIYNPKKIKFRGSKAFILAEDYIIRVDAKTFEDDGVISGFMDPVDFDFADPADRLFVVDNEASEVKVVSLDRLEIVSDIETGHNTKPSFILRTFEKLFVLNGGGISYEDKDSTVIVVKYRNNLVPLANFEGNLEIGDNPNSAVITSSGRLKVLCKGVYDQVNPSNNSESALSDINQYDNTVYSTSTLTGVYNAQNLIVNFDGNTCYFTALGGIYRLNPTTLNYNLLVNVDASTIKTNVESFFVNDSTTIYYEMLYMNDYNSPNSIYKYNISTASFEDTIIVDGEVRDINFY